MGYDVQTELHQLRKEIDRTIQKAQAMSEMIARGEGGREVALVITKLQEAKMWAGKGLEATGSELPAQYQDKA